MPVAFDRTAMLERLAGESFDVLVIGGGVTGAGVALDAASRGLRTALVEADDFASGTSSKSSKLVHGGLRYLQNRDVRLVYQALRERKRLRHNAPHLVRGVAPQPLALGQRLVDEGDLALLEVAQTTVDQLRALRRGARGEVVALHQRRAQAPAGGVEGHARTGDPAPDDQHVERLVGQAAQRGAAFEGHGDESRTSSACALVQSASSWSSAPVWTSPQGAD